MTEYKWSDPPSRTAFPIARAGYRPIIAAAFVTAVLALIGLTLPALLGLVITAFICYFFRDPDRIIPIEPGAMVSPADGKVISADTVTSNPLGDGACLKVSVFMSVFNVHVNRMPSAGRITRILYYPGTFFSANLDKASDQNEHNAVFYQMETGRNICVVQIAGLIARRIICYVNENENVDRGQRFGIICFGSRLDLYLPKEARLTVSVGDKVKAGKSIVAYLR
ncbi:MAG: phosphatidylserine decarboxylase family protein [Desulfosudaceae bacterium]